MFIKTQDKKGFVNMCFTQKIILDDDDFNESDENGKYFIRAVILWDKYEFYKLGTYSSVEKAELVVKQIYDFIDNWYDASISTNPYSMKRYILIEDENTIDKNLIFEMPEDVDVN